jgi:hypothetical protein
MCGSALGIIIIIMSAITFMQGIYNYVPETNHVSHAECSVPLHQHFMQQCAVHNMAVVWQFLNFMLSRYVAQILFEWFQWPLILMVSLLFLHSTCAVLLV